MQYRLRKGCHTVSTCPSMSTDPGSRNPGTRRSRVPGLWIPGSVRILGQVTQFWQKLLNVFYSTGSWKLFWYPFTGIVCQREAVWVAAGGDLWSCGPTHKPHLAVDCNHLSMTYIPDDLPTCTNRTAHALSLLWVIAGQLGTVFTFASNHSAL